MLSLSREAIAWYGSIMRGVCREQVRAHWVLHIMCGAG